MTKNKTNIGETVEAIQPPTEKKDTITKLEQYNELFDDMLDNRKTREFNAAQALTKILILVPIQLLAVVAIFWLHLPLYVLILVAPTLVYQIYRLEDILSLLSFLIFMRPKAVSDRIKELELQKTQK